MAGTALRSRSAFVNFFVKSERSFVQIAEEMEGLDVDVPALDRALKQAPEIFPDVRVNLAVNISLRVVNDAYQAFGLCLPAANSRIDFPPLIQERPP
jgi:hypothetical protein